MSSRAFNRTSTAKSVSAQSGEEEPPTDIDQVRIEFGVSPSVTFASQQNSIPILRRLRVHHSGSTVLRELQLKLSSEPGFLREKTWVIDQLDPGMTISLDDRDLRFDLKYLAGLDEAEQGSLCFSLISDGELIARAEAPIRVLARDQWGGIESMGELLPAFVMPNDPAISTLLKDAAEILRSHSHSTALDGYQARDQRRTELQLSALWSAVCNRGLVYANPPAHFERSGQKIRRPGVVFSDSLATCLDSSLLFASAIEAIGINPVIVLSQGHSCVAAWLSETSFGRLIETDCTEIRKAVGEGKLVLIESTLVTHQPAARYPDAVKVAQKWIHQLEDRDFVAAIDVARARMVKIRPLASHHSPEQTEHAGTRSDRSTLFIPESSSEPLQSSLSETKPTTPQGRIDRWHHKLLDLTLRNRLLNFRATKKTIPLLCPNISLLEDKLADGKKLKIISLSDQDVAAGRDLDHHEKVTLEDLRAEFSKSALERNQLCSTLADEELAKRLTNLYRSSRNDLAEGGSNTLYLAVGFLRWKERPSEDRQFRAPLLLVPATLIRKRAGSDYRLAHHEDDVRFNATLIQKLKRDFDCDLSGLESNLPRDDSGVNVQAVLQQVRAVIADLRGFEVVDESALASFSFAKYLMWKDLVDRSEYLEQNRVVHHLVRDPDKPFQSAAERPLPIPGQMDSRYKPAELIHPLDADSSQLAAVMAAAEGHDFVLVGPPGTGKSQTIANMISQCLAVGKTVLFVAEKTAALDVVQRRLEQHGLGDFCVELHSNKAERKRFLRQLDQCWQHGGKKRGKNWKRINDKLLTARNQLNSYANALHQQAANGWTVYQAIGITAANPTTKAPVFSWPEALQHDAATIEQMERVVHQIDLAFRPVSHLPALNAIRATQWSIRWEQQLIEHLEDCQNSIVSVGKSLQQLCQTLGVPASDASHSCLKSLHRLCCELVAVANQDYRTVFDEQLDQLPDALSDLDGAITDYDCAASSCRATFDDDALREIPIDALLAEWEIADQKYWPFSAIGRRSIRQRVRGYANLGEVHLPRDLHSIAAMKVAIAAIDRNPLSEREHLWEHRKTATSRLSSHLQQCLKLKRLIDSFLQTLDDPQASKQPVYRSIKALLDPGTDSQIVVHAKAYVAAYEAYASCIARFEQLADGRLYRADSKTSLADSIEMIGLIKQHRTKLQAWTDWQAVRYQADCLGLNPLIESVVSAEIPTDEIPDRFQLAYARWWLPTQIDRSPELRDFQRHLHEDVVREFCSADAEARAAASDRVRKSVAHRLPSKSEVPRKSELGMLRHQIGLKRPSKSIRELIEMMPEHFAALAPCLLMSPLSIAQYLPADQPPFDVVIFDEASQITTWDAIGAIARGRQTVIVGDPKQLPPTNFFGISTDEDEEEELQDYERDLESILDEAVASGLPTLQLNWHYRSRHESLIAFSNQHYYENQLVTFPSPRTTDSAVQLKHLPDARYDRGKTRTNESEARTIVDDAVARMKSWLELPEQERHTLGVVTFNSQQQTLILDLFDRAQQDDPQLEWFFSDDRVEPTVVKNLENVQGDERDVMLFSITFGADSKGKVPLTFGALNQDGGQRRLNVAITRARQELVVYSSFLPDQLEAERSRARGVRDLKQFLQFAQRGPQPTELDLDSKSTFAELSLENAVAKRLAQLGWDVDCNVGVSGFRIALAVRHPANSDCYLAGIECDGFTYRNAATARDRDKTRELVLRNLGWSILKVWSRQWWYDAEGAACTLDHELRELMQN